MRIQIYKHIHVYIHTSVHVGERVIAALSEESAVQDVQAAVQSVYQVYQYMCIDML